MSGGRAAGRLGRWGEMYAAKYLEEQGLHILERNWRSRFGEIDLITSDEMYLCFTEVKLRKSDCFAPARAFVDRRKQEKLRITAELYLEEHPAPLQPRFDVVEVYAPQGTDTAQPKIFWWKNAF